MREVTFVKKCGLASGMYMPGETRALPADEARLCIEHGWAKDSETGEIGNTPIERAHIEPRSVFTETK